MPLDLPPKAELWLPPKPAIVRAVARDDAALVRPARFDCVRGAFPMPVFCPAGVLAVSTVLGQVPYVTGANASSYNAGSVAIGAAPTGVGTRDLYLFVSSSNSLPTSVLVNGTDIVANIVDWQTGSAHCHGVYRVTVNSGTSATVVVGYGTGQFRFGVAVYSVYNLTDPTNPVVYKSTNLAGDTLNISGFANGAIIGEFSCRVGSGSRTFTWSGASEDYDQLVESAEIYHSGAHIDTAAAGSVAVTCTPSTSVSTASFIMLALK